MARSKVSPKDLQKIRALAAQWGKIVARQVGDAGVADLDFQAMEDLAAAAAAGLTEGTLETLLQQQAQALPAQLPCPGCGRLCPVGSDNRTLTVRAGQTIPLAEPVCHCPDCRRDFFPLRTRLRLDNHHYSPAVLQLIAEAAGRLSSCADAAFALGLAGIPISARHLGRIAAEIGTEMAQQRDQKVVQRRRRQLPARVAAAPEVVVVEVDGGRLRTRATGCGPGVHEPQSKEEKIACLVNLHSETAEHDPQPEPPPSLLLPRRVQRLVRQIKGAAAGTLEEETKPEDTAEAVPVEAACVGKPAQERLRTCVASMANSGSFGPMVAAEAQERDFYRAQRRAFVADGAAYNWSIQQGYFADFEPITDLLHVLCYLYLAAGAIGADEAERWSHYVDWLRACWQGRVAEVLAALRVGQEKIGEPPKGEELDEKDPRRLVAEALSFVGNNAVRMDYPRYRRLGLPNTSSLVESLVGEFNARVKGREKFWNRPSGAEPILQLRAAVLSEDDRLASDTSPNDPATPTAGEKWVNDR